MIDIQYNLWGPIVAIQKVDTTFVKQVKEEGRKTYFKWNSNLAGEIEKEYLFTDVTFIDKGLRPYIDNYFELTAPMFSHRHPIKRGKWELTSCWINYQKKGEYNPVHTHNYCDFSFVLYVDVPEEINQEVKNNKNVPNGAITFHYGEKLPFNKCAHVHRPHTNEFILFPSWVNHSVEKFYSDVERVSMAGNIKITDEEFRRSL